MTHGSKTDSSSPPSGAFCWDDDSDRRSVSGRHSDAPYRPRMPERARMRVSTPPVAKHMLVAQKEEPERPPPGASRNPARARGGVAARSLGPNERRSVESRRDDRHQHNGGRAGLVRRVSRSLVAGAPRAAIATRLHQREAIAITSLGRALAAGIAAPIAINPLRHRQAGSRDDRRGGRDHRRRRRGD
jgi:hypothetical protein